MEIPHFPRKHLNSSRTKPASQQKKARYLLALIADKEQFCSRRFTANRFFIKNKIIWLPSPSNSSRLLAYFLFLREGLESGSLPPLSSGSYVAESPTCGRGRLFLSNLEVVGHMVCHGAGC